MISEAILSFSETGLVGMLETSDFSSIDQVSPFLGSIAGYFCGNVYNQEVTRLFTSFVDLLRVINRYNRNPG